VLSVPRPLLSSLQNPLVKDLRKLHRAKIRRDRARVLLEGTNAIATACELQAPLDVLCATPEWQAKHPLLWEQAKAARRELATPEVLAKLATTVTPDGVVAGAARSAFQKPLPEAMSLTIAGERLQDPGNLGAILRTAAAVGVEGIWLEDSVDCYAPKTIRASAGLALRLAIADSFAGLAEFRARGGQVVAALPRAERSLWECDFTRPTAILVGNEGAGLSAERYALADVRVSIPVVPEVESLNVAIATAVLLYEVERQRRAARHPRPHP